MPKKVSDIINRVGAQRSRASAAQLKNPDYIPKVMRMTVFDGPLYSMCKAEVQFDCPTSGNDSVCIKVEYPIADGRHLPGRMTYLGESRGPDLHLNRAMAKEIRKVIGALKLEKE